MRAFANFSHVTHVTPAQDDESRNAGSTVMRNVLDELYDSLLKAVDTNVTMFRAQLARCVAESTAGRLTRSRVSARLKRAMVGPGNAASRGAVGDDDADGADTDGANRAAAVSSETSHPAQ